MALLLRMTLLMMSRIYLLEDETVGDVEDGTIEDIEDGMPTIFDMDNINTVDQLVKLPKDLHSVRCGNWSFFVWKSPRTQNLHISFSRTNLPRDILHNGGRCFGEFSIS